MSNTLRGDPVVDRIMQAVLTRITHWERANNDMQTTTIRNERSDAIRISIKRRDTIGDPKKKSLTQKQKRNAFDLLEVLRSDCGLIDTAVDERCTHTRSSNKTDGLQIHFLLPSNLQPLQ